MFPAAILQPPFFDVNADDAVNYGGIGAVIGHEIGHGFDDQGRKSDGKGMLRDWWTDGRQRALQAAHRQRSSRSTTPTARCPGMNVNGELTLGENIGDLGGLAMAYNAYQLVARRQAGAGDRRPHRRPALLPRLGAGVARASTATRRCASGS